MKTKQMIEAIETDILLVTKKGLAEVMNTNRICNHKFYFAHSIAMFFVGVYAAVVLKDIFDGQSVSYSNIATDFQNSCGFYQDASNRDIARHSKRSARFC